MLCVKLPGRRRSDQSRSGGRREDICVRRVAVRRVDVGPGELQPATGLWR